MDEIQKAIQAAQAERRLHIAGCFSNAADLKESSEDIHKAEDGNEEETAEETEEVSKAEETETEETAEGAEDGAEEETEKSVIMYALGRKDGSREQQTKNQARRRYHARIAQRACGRRP